jgi:WD40 repeat protein
LETLGPLAGDVEQLLFSPDGALLAAASVGGVHLWSMADRSEPRVLSADDPRIGRLSFSSNGRLIAAACHDRSILLWEVATDARKAVWSGHRDMVHDLEFTPDGSAVLSCSRDGTLRYWRVPQAGDGTATNERVIEAGKWPWSIAFGNQRRTVVTSGHDGTLQFWDMAQVCARPDFGAVPQQVGSIRFSPDDTKLLVARMDGTVAAWDAERQEIETAFANTRHTVTCAAQYSPDGASIAVARENGDILVYRADGTGEPQRLSGHTRAVTGLCFLPMMETALCSCSFDGTVRCWDLMTGRETHRVQFQPGDPLAIAVSLVGDRLAAGDGTQLVVWKIPAWEEELRVPELHGKPESLEFSADGRRLLSAHGDHVVQLRDLDNRGTANVLTGHTGKVMGAVFSRDGRTIVSAAADGTVRLWHVPTLQELGVLHRGAENFYSLCISHDGRRLAAGYYGAESQSGLLLWAADTTSKSVWSGTAGVH